MSTATARQTLTAIDSILIELANDISRADFNEEKMAVAIARLTERAEREQRELIPLIANRRNQS